MTARLVRWLGGRLAFGGDYNPEQWDAPVWQEDDRLMRRARVNLVTLGVFSWAQLEPEEGRYDFGALDAQLDRLHAAGVGVDLATPTASPPPWFSLAHPDALPVTADGVRLTHGSRDTYCLAAPAYRSAARGIARALALRYGRHPAVAMWHVHNEYATVCWCDHAAAAFRVWLRARYGSLDALNEAWGTAFWSQRYGAWEQVLPPRATQWHRNPALVLDYRRFWSDEALAAYREQRDMLRAHSPGDRPVTTNLMLPGYQVLDLWAFGREVDFVGVDHYPDAPGRDAAADTAFGADRARSLGGGKPWLLIEQGASTVHAGDRTLPKEPGQALRHTLAHIARGSEGAMFFQWRQSRAGAELWHSAMVPHAGADSRIFREVTAIGEAVSRLGEVAGSRVRAEAALLHDADAWWALESQGLPSAELDYHAAMRRAHRTLWDAGITADIAHPADPALDRYRLLIAPALHLLSAAGARALRSYVHGGGTLLVQHFGGAVDERAQAWLGGSPAPPLREALGIRVEEFRPLAAGERIRLSDGTTATAWSEYLTAPGAQVVTAYTHGMLAGCPAVTRHPHGTGVGWYLSTQPDDAGYAALLARIAAEAGVRPELAGAAPGVVAHEAVVDGAVADGPAPGPPPGPVADEAGGVRQGVRPGPLGGVEAVRRRSQESTRSWLFLLNHADRPVVVPAALLGGGHDLLTGRLLARDEDLTLPGGGAAVLRQD